MIDQLFKFLANGVVERASGYRPGARHPLMFYAAERSLEAAQQRASDFGGKKGWAHIEFKRGKEISRDTQLIADETLRSAAEKALQSGVALVVYSVEIPADG